MVRKAGRLSGDELEDIINKRIHDTHGLARNTRIGMTLLKHLVDGDRIALFSLSLPLFLGPTIGFRATLVFPTRFLTLTEECHGGRPLKSVMADGHEFLQLCLKRTL